MLTFLVCTFATKASQLPVNESLSDLKNNLTSLINDGKRYNLGNYKILKFALRNFEELEDIKIKIKK